MLLVFGCFLRCSASKGLPVVLIVLAIPAGITTISASQRASLYTQNEREKYAQQQTPTPAFLHNSYSSYDICFKYNNVYKYRPSTGSTGQ